MKLDRQSVAARPPHIPLVWSHGMGVDSTAVACLLVEWGLKADLTLMANPGGEMPATLDYIPIMNEFLTRHGHPAVRVIKKRSKYESLEANCLATDALPSKAYGGGSCSEKWKIEPQRFIVQHWEPARRCWGRGDKVLKLLGYDAGDRDRHRYAQSIKKEDPKYEFWTPLIDMKLTRDACKGVIRNAGLPVPVKSSCFFCPAMKWPEIRDLATKHPDLLERAIQMEVTASQGKHGLGTVRGLGRNFSWTERLAEISPAFAVAHAAELQILEDHRGRRNR